MLLLFAYRNPADGCSRPEMIPKSEFVEANDGIAVNTRVELFETYETCLVMKLFEELL
jgi:hypothetical protein